MDALTRSKKRLYKLNARAIEVFLNDKSNVKLRSLLESHIGEKIYDEKEIVPFLDSLKISFYLSGKLRTAMHIGAMSEGHLGLTGEALVSDDAPNFKGLLKSHCLCWVHELRHYKLLPVMYEEHAEILEGFLTASWDLVSLLEEYQDRPSEKLRERIHKRVDSLFIKPSIWPLLDKQKALTAQKLDKLLYPLLNKTIPTNNNLAERDLRGRVIKRKVSLFNQSARGALAWDLWGSLKETTRKLGLNFWHFVEDRISLKFAVPSLSAMSIS